jgi:hypothetical protein
MSISNYAELAFLNTMRNVSFVVAVPYMKLHLGDPGENGTANAAVNAIRKAVSFGDASGGSMVSNGIVEWTDVSTTETYTHWSLWDDSVAGNCLWSGVLSSSATVTDGDTFRVTSLVLSLD